MKTIIIQNIAPGKYSIHFHEDNFEHHILLNARETVFMQLILQNLQERLEDKTASAAQPAWGKSSLN